MMWWIIWGSLAFLHLHLRVAGLSAHGLALLGLILHNRAIGRLNFLRFPFFVDMVDMVAGAMVAPALQLAFSRRTARWIPAREARHALLHPLGADHRNDVGTLAASSFP